MFDRRTGLLIGMIGTFTGFVFGNVFLIVAGALIIANESINGQNNERT